MTDFQARKLTLDILLDVESNRHEIVKTKEWKFNDEYYHLIDDNVYCDNYYNDYYDDYSDDDKYDHSKYYDYVDYHEDDFYFDEEF